MSTIYEFGWPVALKAIHFPPKGHYLLIQIRIGVTTDFPDPKITVTPHAGAKQIYKRDQIVDNPNATETVYVAWLPAQSMPIHGDPISYQEPCIGFFNYFQQSGVVTVGQPDAQTAFDHQQPNDMPGVFFNTNKESIYSGCPQSFAGIPEFSAFTPGKGFKNVTEAQAFAAVLSGEVGNGWTSSPAQFHLDPLTGCAIVDSPPGEFTWHPTWLGDKVTQQIGPTKIREYVAMLLLNDKGSPLPVCSIKLSGGSGWNDDIYSYDQKNHRFAPGNTAGGPTPRVWFPILPFTNPKDHIDIGNNDTSVNLAVMEDGTIIPS